MVFVPFGFTLPSASSETNPHSKLPDTIKHKKTKALRRPRSGRRRVKPGFNFVELLMFLWIELHNACFRGITNPPFRNQSGYQTSGGDIKPVVHSRTILGRY